MNLPKEPKFNAHNVSKFVARQVVAATVASAVTKFIQNNTESDSNTVNTTAKIAGSVAGWYVGEKLEPYTNNLVDKTFDSVKHRKRQDPWDTVPSETIKTES